MKSSIIEANYNWYVLIIVILQIASKDDNFQENFGWCYNNWKPITKCNIKTKKIYKCKSKYIKHVRKYLL